MLASKPTAHQQYSHTNIGEEKKFTDIVLKYTPTTTWFTVGILVQRDLGSLCKPNFIDFSEIHLGWFSTIILELTQLIWPSTVFFFFFGDSVTLISTIISEIFCDSDDQSGIVWTERVTQKKLICWNSISIAIKL